MKYLPGIFLALVFIASCRAQSATVVNSSSNKYFGQTPPGLTPEIFSPGFISSEEFEFAGTFNGDYSEYFFTRRPTLQGSANRIFYTKIINGKWIKPVLAPFAQDIFEYEPFISPDGERLFFQSDRAGAAGEADLWIIERNNNEWQLPKYIGEALADGFVMYVTETYNRKIYFTGGFNGLFGIFYSKFENGQYSKPMPFPSKEKIFRGAHPFIDPDERFIIFDMQPSGSGMPELFISFNEGGGSWSEPVNMGPVINKTKTEFAASISNDGKYLFFHRVEKNNGDIYWVDAKIIEQLKK